MKPLKRVLGIDDSSFDREVEERTLLVGVLARFDGYVEGVVTREASIDGMDSTDAIISMFSAHFGSEVDYVMLNGITFAGFNICDLNRVWKETGVPVVSITRKRPDIESMNSAVRKHFPDHERRIEVLTSTVPVEITIRPGSKVYANIVGMELQEASELIRKTIVRGNMPEPVRLAHIIAGGIKNGESRGKP